MTVQPLLRTTLLIALGAAVSALVLTLGANPIPTQKLAVHTKSHVWIHVKYRSASEHVRVLRTIARHDKWVQATGKTHTAKAVSFHSRELAHAKVKLRKLYLRDGSCNGYYCARKIVCQFDWSPFSCSEVLVLVNCESNYDKNNWTGQYYGWFQMGSNERRGYGGSSSDAVEQTRAAWTYFVRSGRDFSPWQCTTVPGVLRW